jgi:hypothetical protein
VLAGIAGTTHAVNVNNDGLGQVLIYPYYTVQEGVEVSGVAQNLDTLLSVYNTTETVKAVKVRFLDGQNSREVLDFNLYLSPFDVWTASISRSGEGAIMRTTDNSCTVPAIPADGVEFRNLAFGADEGDTSLARTREGHIEIIEMGVVSGALAAAATHGAGGTPTNCGLLESAWSPGGVWAGSNGQDSVSPATGGLAGRVDLVDVRLGASAAYGALALDNFWLPEAAPVHAAPGSTDPSLNNAFPLSTVFVSGNGFDAVIEESIWDRGIDAVSAVLMHNEVYNEYVLDEITAASTAWVLTFPTKSFYVNPPVGEGTTAEAEPPFTRRFQANRGACEDVLIALFDREEQTVSTPLDFSPPRPGEDNVLCWEANVITFDDTNRIGSELNTNVNPAQFGFENGWMALSFANPNNALTSLDGDTYSGLPVVGFALVQHLNLTQEIAGTSVLANYTNLMPHKFTRSISSDD